MELSAKAIPISHPLPQPTTAPGRRQTIQMLVWVAAILLFGFGDTFTSLLVFGSGGVEANVLLGAVLKLLGPTVRNFLILKAVATAVPVLLARLNPRLELLASGAMLLIGMFLVAQNLAALLL